MSVQVVSSLHLSQDLTTIPNAVLIVLERDLMALAQQHSGERRNGTLALVADHLSMEHAWLGQVRAEMLRRDLLLDKAAEACLVRLKAWIEIAPRLAHRRRKQDLIWLEENVSPQAASDPTVLALATAVSTSTPGAVLMLMQRRSRSEVLALFPFLQAAIDQAEDEASFFGPARKLTDIAHTDLHSLSVFANELERAGLVIPSTDLAPETDATHPPSDTRETRDAGSAEPMPIARRENIFLPIPRT